jgi:alanyl-tRNA synthetase
MESQLLYQQDPGKLEFEASVVELVSLPDGRKGVVLDQTYFYPTGGGQEHDTGMIGSARVVDVYKDEAHSQLVHIVVGELGLGPVKASIDADRRLRHMQHHTAQHLLTQCVLLQTGYETVSANINGYSPSTLDVVAPKIAKSDLDLAEVMANQIIYEDRLVKTYFISPAELTSIPLRRPPKVTENIRIVEIDGFDYSPCGGTHVLRTGSIGLVKVVKTEQQKDKLRIHFIAGTQALDVFRHMYESFTGLASQMSTSWQVIPELVIKQADQLNVLQKELLMMRKVIIKYEALDLADNAELKDGIRTVRAIFKDRQVSEIRLLAEEVKKIAGLVAYLATYDGQKINLIVACSEGTGMDARQLLTAELVQFGGRGGGDARLAQGGAVMDQIQYHQFMQQFNTLDK